MRRQRADILAVVQRAEAEIAAEIDEGRRQISALADRDVRRTQAKHEYLELKDALRRAQQERVGSHVLLSGRLAAELQGVRAQLRIDQEKLEARAPSWKALLRSLEPMLRKTGYDNRTRWRSRAKAVLVEAQRTLRRRHGVKDGASDASAHGRALRDAVRRINMLSAAELLGEVEAVMAAADAAEAVADPSYAVLQRRVEAGAGRAASLEQQTREAKAKATADGDAHRHTARHRLRELEREFGGGPAARAEPFDFSASFSAPLRADLEDLRHALPPTRETRAELEARYRRFFGRCAAAGAWREAFGGLESLISVGLEADLHTFQTLVTACKNAQPCQAAKAVEIFDMMCAQGVPPTTAMANVVIGACSVGARWREALALFKRLPSMHKRYRPLPGAPPLEPLKPNTATYTALIEVCKGAPLADLPELYDAMKFAGVPEFIAFQTGQQRLSASKRSPKKSYFDCNNTRDALVLDGFEDGGGGAGGGAGAEPSPYVSR